MRAEGAAAIVDLAKVSSEFSLLKLSRGNVLMRLNDFTPWQEARHGLNRNLKALPFTTLLVALREFRYGSRLCDTRPGSSTDLGLFNRDFRFCPVKGHRRSVGPLPKSARNGDSCAATNSGHQNSLSVVQLGEQRLGLLQIERVEAFGEPAVDRREQLASLLRLPLITPKPRHARGGAEFPGFGLLRPCYR